MSRRPQPDSEEDDEWNEDGGDETLGEERRRHWQEDTDEANGENVNLSDLEPVPYSSREPEDSAYVRVNAMLLGMLLSIPIYVLLYLGWLAGRWIYYRYGV